jgi:urease accessory protein
MNFACRSGSEISRTEGFSMKRGLLRAGLAVSMMAPGAALAHTGVGSTHGFDAGFLHPLGGLDHQLAMVLVGLLAWQLGGRALWLVPGAFIAMMAVGGACGVYGVALPLVEAGIAVSVVTLGIAVAFGLRPPIAVAMAAVGLFAVFHGHAHGSEMPLDMSGAAYAAGFMAATAALHAFGIGLGFVVGRLADGYGRTVYRIVGGASAAAGLVLLAGAF